MWDFSTFEFESHQSQWDFSTFEFESHQSQWDFSTFEFESHQSCGIFQPLSSNPIRVSGIFQPLSSNPIRVSGIFQPLSSNPISHVGFFNLWVRIPSESVGFFNPGRLYSKNCIRKIWIMYEIYYLYQRIIILPKPNQILPDPVNYAIWICKTVAVLAHVLCTPYNHAPVYSITSCKATCIRVYVCLAVPATFTVGSNMVVKRIPKWLSAEKWGETDTETDTEMS